MKLRNKRTGEIGNFCYGRTNELCVSWQKDDGFWGKQEYNSLAELNEDWQDYEEPKVGYIVDPMEEDCVSEDESGYEESDVERAKELGIWFETKEEAELAVRKLKAWKRLKDKGFRFNGWSGTQMGSDISYIREVYYEGCTDDMDLLFGGEE